MYHRKFIKEHHRIDNVLSNNFRHYQHPLPFFVNQRIQLDLKNITNVGAEIEYYVNNEPPENFDFDRFRII